MFEHVGKDLDEEAARRQAKAGLITLILWATVGGIAFGYASYKVAEEVLDLADDDDLIEVVMDEDEMEAPPPPPPPPPPPAAAEEEEEEEETPDEMTEEIVELDEKVEEEVKSEVDKGEDDGEDEGEEGGVEGGVIGGVVGGVLGGQLGGVMTFHHSELEVKKRIMPPYPESAKEMDLQDQRCMVKVYIDESGVPYNASVENCPKVFHAPTKAAIMKWRWYPPRIKRQKVKAQTVIVFNYKLKD